MAKARARRSRVPANLAGWRLALIYLLIGAFGLQSYIVQTHIHLPESLSSSLAGSANLTPQPLDHHDKYPPADDPANCPFCQEILHSGQFVTPIAQALLLPSLPVSTIALVEPALPFIFTLSHSWRGRAPPLS